MFFSTAVVLIPRMPASWLDVIFGLFLISAKIRCMFFSDLLTFYRFFAHLLMIYEQ